MCGAIKTKSSALLQCSVKSSRRIRGCSFYALIWNCIGGRYKKSRIQYGQTPLQAEEVSKHYNTTRT